MSENVRAQAAKDIGTKRGIARLLPDVTGIEPGWNEAPEIQPQGSASWHGSEHAVRPHLANIQIR